MSRNSAMIGELIGHLSIDAQISSGGNQPSQQNLTLTVLESSLILGCRWA